MADLQNDFRIGQVALTVNDLDQMREFYENTIGLHLQSHDKQAARLGIGDQTLLELRHDPAARRRSADEAGLFHTAFLLPERADLAQWSAHAIAQGVALTGASDHLVSEALYLDDPEGNGIEIYIDRPRDQWEWQDGLVRMATLRLDMDDLLAQATGPVSAMPQGTTVGHVHLQVGALPQAEAFYAGTLGLEITSRYPGGTFYAANGYHHHLATNIWNSRGAGQRQFPATGLAEVELIMSPARREGIANRAALKQETLLDPWGTPFTLTTG